MRRLRLLRVLIPALLLPFIALLIWSARQRPEREAGAPQLEGSPPPLRAEKVDITDLEGAARRGSIRAGVVEPDDRGGLRLRDIERIEVERSGGSPLLLSAAKGAISPGASGKRLLRLEGGVRIQDQDAGITVTLPTLEVNEATGEARSLGEVLIESPETQGRAAGVVYGLRGQPTELLTLDLHDRGGGRLEAGRALLPRDSQDVLLSNGVRLERGEDTMAAREVTLRRDSDGRLREALAEGEVVITRVDPAGVSTTASARRAEAGWDEAGHRVRRLRLDGAASVRQGTSLLIADEIRAERSAEEGSTGWQVLAQGEVRGTATLAQGPSLLRSDVLRASLDGNGMLTAAVASGEVRLESPGAAAEAGRADYRPARTANGTLTLTGTARIPARLIRERTRVAAVRIITDVAGTRLEAEGSVEASLLPAEDGRPAPGTAGVFDPEEPVHFVASSMVSADGGRRLRFEGSVRGWQGERYLSSDVVQLDQDRDTLIASGNVQTRIPRAAEGGSSATAFVQAGSKRLEYRGETGEAVYTGSVRVRQGEGWMEAERVEVDLPRDGSAAREMRAFDEVRFEYRAPGEAGVPRPVRGDGDRLVYLPAENLVRLYGDRKPATVRREGEGGGTTIGRVLRYRLDLGQIEVESGARDRARIRTTPD